MYKDYTADLTSKVAIHILKSDPSKIDLVIKVQEELNNTSGILREGNLAFTMAGRDRRTGDQGIRDSTITWQDHINRFENNDLQKRKVKAFVGNGNLLMNRWFVAWIEGELFHVQDEPFEDKIYSSIVVWKGNKVTIEELRFEKQHVILADDKQDITDKILYTTYGQRLLNKRAFIDPIKIKEQYYDIRHLFLFPFFGDKEGYFGLYQLESNQQLLTDALNGKAIELDLNVDEDMARRALKDRNYVEIESSERMSEGEYQIFNDKIRIILKSGLFPHNIIGITNDNQLVSIVVSGQSNTAGLMLDKAEKLFDDINEKLSIEINDAVLLDNGADVMMYSQNDWVVKSFMSPPRDRLRSLILYVAPESQTSGIEHYKLTDD